MQRPDKDSTNRHEVYKGHELRSLHPDTAELLNQGEQTAALGSLPEDSSLIGFAEGLSVLCLAEVIRAPGLAGGYINCLLPGRTLERHRWVIVHFFSHCLSTLHFRFQSPLPTSRLEVSRWLFTDTLIVLKSFHSRNNMSLLTGVC